MLGTCIEGRLKCSQKLWEKCWKSFPKGQGKSITLTPCSFSRLGEQVSTVHLDFCCTILASHGLYAFTLVKTEQVVWFQSERHGNPCTVPGFAELLGEGVSILQGQVCFPSVLHKYLKVPITRATSMSWSDVFKEQNYFLNVTLLLYVCINFTARRRLSFPFGGKVLASGLKNPKQTLCRKSSKLEPEIISLP